MPSENPAKTNEKEKMTMAKTKNEVTMFSGIENFEKFTIAEVCNGALDELIKAGIPIVLHGGTGIGKTVIGHTISDRLGYEFKYTQPAAHEAIDFAGMPTEDKVKQVMKFIISDMLSFDPSKKHIWLIDELNRALPDVRQVLLGLFNEPAYVGSHKLPDNVSIIVCQNSASLQQSVNVSDDDAAQTSRVANAYVYSTLTDTVNYFLTKYNPANFFIKFLQSDFAKKIISADFSTEFEKASGEILLVPRVLEKAVKIVEAHTTAEKARNGSRLVGSLVGQYCKSQYLQFLAECESLDPDEFFKKNSKVLKEVLARPKTAENSTLLLTAAVGAVNSMPQKKPAEWGVFFETVEAMQAAKWGEIVGATIAAYGKLGHHDLNQYVTANGLGKLIISLSMNAKDVADTKAKSK